ncbi:uncharacterized protein LOC112557403 [Pomacea canaliculata]|uniref:uncharacterized protein LOC112557403 n=1 Tax=Pomacea canaliculata TaxID=400727 RepID=UPI000D72E4C6|nr:uncharacterized protein LOC112557403 [Pomacea canaliculata]
MAFSKVDIVNTMEKCDRALQGLKRESYLAVDGEGVNLSKTGPLTLLQVGTKDGEVYLFDVFTEPRILKTGGLKAILESETIVKVMHSSKNDATALYWQFGVKLHNVFDTQVAHMELQRAEGRRLPSRMKLTEVCGLYCPQKADLLEEKEDVQTRWSKREGEFWAKRPMTQEMIDYASQDVLVLIPEIYITLKGLVNEKGLTRQVTERISLEIEAAMDEDVRNRLKEAADAVVLEILQTFARTTRPPDSLSDIMDEGDNTVPSRHMYDVLFRGICHSGDEALKQLGKGIGSRLDKILLKDMERKYTRQTPIQHIADFEKRVLDRCLHPLGENDPTVTPVLLRLYWLLQEESIDSSMQQFNDNPSTFRINPGYVKKLRFFLSGKGVPSRLKTKAQSFLKDLEAAGLVVRPPRRRNFHYDDE